MIQRLWTQTSAGNNEPQSRKGILFALKYHSEKHDLFDEEIILVKRCFWYVYNDHLPFKCLLMVVCLQEHQRDWTQRSVGWMEKQLRENGVLITLCGQDARRKQAQDLLRRQTQQGLKKEQQ